MTRNFFKRINLLNFVFFLTFAAIITPLVFIFIFFLFKSFIFFPFIFICWRLIPLQYCSGFCHTLTWISHGFTCVHIYFNIIFSLFFPVLFKKIFFETNRILDFVYSIYPPSHFINVCSLKLLSDATFYVFIL